MGSQQLLLVVVGVIIVGLMIYAGYNISMDYMENANRDQVISRLYDLGLLAQQHFKKDVTQGGGSGSYIGWAIPSQFQNTQSGFFSEAVRTDRVELSGDGNVAGRNGRTNIRVTARVNKDGIKITIIN
ncbi:MAG: Uncharacterized protein FD143_2657 [Ignavibacteria bacterium]|nr:MAG: Uncharacterized protein FD143_2657 [Ignavibacteria bacterium]KAF0156125.1 MAG: Uncharacterized protein FD188_3016 [Ignavibacteria bacterium]